VAALRLTDGELSAKFAARAELSATGEGFVYMGNDERNRGHMYDIPESVTAGREAGELLPFEILLRLHQAMA
jgi:hypothetical protein